VHADGNSADNFRVSENFDFRAVTSDELRQVFAEANLETGAQLMAAAAELIRTGSDRVRMIFNDMDNLSPINGTELIAVSKPGECIGDQVWAWLGTFLGKPPNEDNQCIGNSIHHLWHSSLCRASGFVLPDIHATQEPVGNRSEGLMWFFAFGTSFHQKVFLQSFGNF
jgi:hypothetical protein